MPNSYGVVLTLVDSLSRLLFCPTHPQLPVPALTLPRDPSCQGHQGTSVGLSQRTFFVLLLQKGPAHSTPSSSRGLFTRPPFSSCVFSCSVPVSLRSACLLTCWCLGKGGPRLSAPCTQRYLSPLMVSLNHQLMMTMTSISLTQIFSLSYRSPQTTPTPHEHITAIHLPAENRSFCNPELTAQNSASVLVS